nr:protein disulfide isomerase-like 2-3 [Tanacetum cinerariifolium]
GYFNEKEDDLHLTNVDFIMEWLARVSESLKSLSITDFLVQSALRKTSVLSVLFFDSLYFQYELLPPMGIQNIDVGLKNQKRGFCRSPGQMNSPKDDQENMSPKNGKVDDLIKDKIEAAKENKAKENEEQDVSFECLEPSKKRQQKLVSKIKNSTKVLVLGHSERHNFPLQKEFVMCMFANLDIAKKIVLDANEENHPMSIEIIIHPTKNHRFSFISSDTSLASLKRMSRCEFFARTLQENPNEPCKKEGSFFQVWHCKKLAPEWEKAAKNLQGKVKLNLVNCDDDKSLMSRYKVVGFLTILVFGADKESPPIYEGARSASATESFALIMMEINVAPPEVTELTSPDVMEEKCGSAAICFVAYLPDILDSKAEGRNKCGHCKKLAPEWKKAAKNLQGKVKLGYVKCDDEKSLMSRSKKRLSNRIICTYYAGTNVAPPKVTALTSLGSVDITKGTFTIASWRGTKVAVKNLRDELFTDKVKVLLDTMEVIDNDFDRKLTILKIALESGLLLKWKNHMLTLKIKTLSIQISDENGKASISGWLKSCIENFDKSSKQGRKRLTITVVMKRKNILPNCEVLSLHDVNNNLIDINIDALCNILKQNQGDVNDAMRLKKKTVVVASDPLAMIVEKTKSANKKQEFVKSNDKKVEKKDDEKKRDMSKVKCYNCKKEDNFAKDCKKAKVKDYEYYKTKMLLAIEDKDEQVLFAEDHAWMESSSDSDQEINANMVFMAQIEKVLSDSEASSSFVDDKISEIINPDFDKIVSSFQQTSSLKLYVMTVILEKIIIDLEDEVVSLLKKEKENLKTIESLKSKDVKKGVESSEKGVESSEKVVSKTENQSENDCQVIKKVCDSEENSTVIASGMFKLNLDILSSVRRPKPSGVMWMTKGSSNTVKADLSSINHSNLNKNVKRYSCKNLTACNNSDTRSAFDCKNARNDLCNARMNASVDMNDLFVFDDIIQIYLWIIDSGCSKHMTGNRTLLTNFVEKFLGTVCFSNNDFAVIAAYGDVVIGSMTIKKVYYVEGLRHNLFSVGQFCDKGLEIKEKGDIGVFVGYSKESAAFRIYNKRTLVVMVDLAGMVMMMLRVADEVWWFRWCVDAAVVAAEEWGRRGESGGACYSGSGRSGDKNTFWFRSEGSPDPAAVVAGGGRLVARNNGECVCFYILRMK